MAVIDMEDRGTGLAGMIGLTGLIGYLYFPAFLIMAGTGATVTPMEETIISIMSFGTGAIDVTSDSFRAQAVGFSLVSFLLMVFGQMTASEHPMSYVFRAIVRMITRLTLPVIVVLCLIVTRDLYELSSTGYKPMLAVGSLIYLSSFSLVKRLSF